MGAAGGAGPEGGDPEAGERLYIKHVVISGFKSYKEETVVEPFHMGHNVIVGRNGTGKSNFFGAIRFVLSDTYNNLQQQERQALLYEGSGATAMSAYVEIVFDNSGGRFPVDNEEVVLRRTIGLKKDEYFLNRKRIRKSDVVNLLESAGFSRSNPYYIVQQGKVSALCTMKDKERLQLLKEVAGTTVYDERREESVQILKDSVSKREKISEVISYIEQRLEELNAEKQELAECQALDRQRRAIEFSLYNEELRDAREKLERIDTRRDQERDNSNDLHEALVATKAEIKAKDKQCKVIAGELKDLTAEHHAVQEEANAMIARRTELDLLVRTAEEQVNADEEQVERLVEELAAVTKRAEELREELEGTVEPEFEKESKAHDALKARLKECERRAAALYAKQGRSKQFRSQEERDEFLRSEMDAVSERLAAKSAARDAAHEAAEKASADAARATRTIESLKKDLATTETQIEESKHLTEELDARRAATFESRKTAYEQVASTEKELEAVFDSVRDATRKLTRTMPRAVRTGLEAISQLGAEGVHGPLIDLFEVADDRFYTCTEVTAGSSLFHVVVDTDETAARLMAHLEAKRAGRVTFMPLNRIEGPEPPSGKKKDSFPLLEKLDYAPEYEPVMRHVFGKTLVCRSSEVASRLSAELGLNCITLDGSQVSRKGTLKGGFYDVSRSRLAAQAEILDSREKQESLSEALEKQQQAAVQLDQDVAAILSEQQKVDMQRRQARDRFTSITKDLQRTEARVAKQHEQAEIKQRKLAELEADIAALQDQIKSLEDELSTELLANLTASEQQELREVDGEAEALKPRVLEAARKVEVIAGRRAALEQELREDLERRITEIKASLPLERGGTGGLAQSEHTETLEKSRRELEEVTRQLERSTQQLREFEAKEKEKAAEVQRLEEDLDALRAQDAEETEKLQQEAKQMEKLLSKRALYVQRREENMALIRELGALPTDEIEKIKTVDRATLQKRLRKTNEALKKFSHVNKKALDQFSSFSERRKTLLARKEELETGHQEIERLIDELDVQKDEAILRTFKGVSKHFSEVFEELVPSGSARLCMLRDGMDDGSSEDEEKKGDADEASVGSFQGVGVEVSFTEAGKSKRMELLSGGQKAVVALALIFAIQRCDPAPFYLFDEIDQALDNVHRASVARLIATQARSAQFITSTFRPELVEQGDRFYGISYQHKVSRIHTQDKDDAIAFVKTLVAEGEAGAAARAPGDE